MNANDSPPAAPPPPDADFALVQRTLAGDQRAYELLVIKYQRRVERLIGRMVRDTDLVQDIAQINGALADQQAKLGKELSDLADNSSSLLQQIAEMNSKISKAMALGQPVAELSDARENLVTELSGYLGVDITDVGDGNLNISSKNGAPLVVGSKAAAVSVTGTSVDVSFNSQNFGSYFCCRNKIRFKRKLLWINAYQIV